MALPTKVNPGDLIRADLMNEILGRLMSLDQRVSTLEATSGPAHRLSISSIIPQGPIRIGEEIQVVGQNFGFVLGVHRVFVDGIRVLTFKTGSNDGRLIFEIPDIQNVPASGRAATMSVSNLTETELRTLNILPMQIAVGGNVDVSFDSVQPATIVPGNPATFRYKVRSRANQQTQFTLSGTVSGVPNADEWQAQVRIQNDEGAENAQRTITLDPLQEKFFKVQINVVPNNPATFTLTANAVATGVVSTPAAKTFTVNQPTEPPDPTTSLNFQASIPPSAFSGGTIRIAKGASMQISLLATFTATGRFRVTHGQVEGSGWTTAALLGTPQNEFQVTSADLANPPHQRVFPFLVTATQNATAGRLELRLERVVEGGGGPKQIFSANLATT